MPSIYEKLVEIQRDLKAPKNQYNSFSNFNYRSKEDILEAVKPHCHERGCIITCEDKIECLGNGWVYVITVARLTESETGDFIAASGAAREPESRKGMDASQITGTAASYAGKRALGNLFAIDDTKDADSQVYQEQQTPSQDFEAHCCSCGTAAKWPGGTTVEQMNTYLCCPNPDWVL